MEELRYKKPLFCRMGAKKHILDKVYKRFPDPETYDTYVEPFIGGGSVFWFKEPTETEVINDLDSDIIEGYRLVKSVKSRDFPQDLTTLAKQRAYYGKPKTSDVGRLTQKVLKYCNTFGNIGKGNLYKKHNPYSKLQYIDDYQKRLEGVKILNSDYKEVIKRYDSPETFFYLDPPYEDSERLYKHGKFDFEEFKDTLSKVKGKWLLSINDSSNTRRLFKGYYARGFIVKARSNTDVGGKNRKELLISNYAI